MAFFDDLGKVISDKSKEAAGKVKDLTGVIQLRTRLAAEKEKVNKAYINLGKAYYDRHEASAEEEYAADFAAVRAGLMRMAELEDEISELEGTRVCSECGAKVERSALFCSKCGAPMERPVSGETGEQETQAGTAVKAEEMIFAEPDGEDEE